MAETRDFDVVRIARSDGADSGPGYWPVTATPAANAAKKTGKEVAAPRAKAQMIRLDEDDPRFIEWRIKLGILLKQELSLNPDEGNPWYVHFPRGYWLYEKSKHLWVSGYPIKAKLFKTPQEFGLHLIWLLSTSMDYMDCCCIHCNVPSLTKTPSAPDSSTPTPAHLAPPNPANIPPKVSPVPLPTIPGQSPKQATNGSVLQPTPKASPRSKPAEPVGADPRASAVQAQPYTQNHPQIQPPAQNQGISQAQPTVQPQGPPQMQSQAQPQPQTQTRPQAIKWSLQAPFLFRAGELVWYQNGNSWRLGVIAGPGNESFQLIPIGHSAAKQPNVTKVCKEMRPFHAFSVPGVMLPDLQNQVFDQVPWENLFLMAGQDRAKRNNPILDASKMAASKIDASFSLWCPLSDDVNAETVPFYGSFFGAERIEVGDCVRIKPLGGELGLSSDSAVLGLTGIIARRGSPGAIIFRGNIYQLTKEPDGTPAGAPVPLDHLPMALQDETRWRCQVNPSQPWRWVLVKENVLLEEQSVRGRFYPTHRLMPILNEAGFNAAVAEGNVESQYPFLNNRMDGSGGYIGHKINRRDTLGASVPPDAPIVLEPLIRELGRAGGSGSE